jgi:hypothetical protein
METTYELVHPAEVAQALAAYNAGDLVAAEAILKETLRADREWAATNEFAWVATSRLCQELYGNTPSLPPIEVPAVAAHWVPAKPGAKVKVSRCPHCDGMGTVTSVIEQ